MSTNKVLTYVAVVSTDKKKYFLLPAILLTAAQPMYSVSWWYTFELSSGYRFRIRDLTHKYCIEMNVGSSDEVMCKTIWVKFLVGSEDILLLQNIQTGSGANPTSYSMAPVLCLMESWL